MRRPIPNMIKFQYYCQRVRLTVSLLMLFACGNIAFAQVGEGEPFFEELGIVVMEAESVPIGDQWILETEIPGFSGTGYIVGQIDTFNEGGKGLMRFPVQISNAGRYQLSWKSRITEGDSNTDFNDSFARLTDSSGIPIDTVPNENVKIGEWYKVYMNRSNQWSYDARNKDNDPHSLSWNLEADTLYYFEISVRSKGHGLDRIVLWERGSHAFADFVTGTVNNVSLLDVLPESPRFADSDQDGDGLPDSWEMQFGESETSVEADSDIDRDGRSAALEFCMGTDPGEFDQAISLSFFENFGFTWAKYEYTRFASAEKYFEFVVEGSSDLIEWSDSGLMEERFVDDLGGNRRSAYAQTRVNPQAPGPYFRLRAIRKSL